ncbi:hypothetical protein C7G42_33175 [Bradyrhizobium sp. MOS003]|jgi:hypothetical protein|nr:hypothetical protein C7G42_33175 [Bradyrhizobium sp. MOS003]
MTPELLQDTYGTITRLHTGRGICQKGRYVSVAKTVVSLTEDRNQTKKTKEILVGVAGFEPATPASRT